MIKQILKINKSVIFPSHTKHDNSTRPTKLNSGFGCRTNGNIEICHPVFLLLPFHVTVKRQTNQFSKTSFTVHDSFIE